jgi:hypothetical protein
LGNENYKISLADQSVKDYPRSHFKRLRGRYLEFLEAGSGLNCDATEFIPHDRESTSGFWPYAKAKLTRVGGPQRVCGAYKVEPSSETPQKPEGPPPPRRPSASSKDSVSFLCWAMKQEMDCKMVDLDQKINLLIKMHGPTIEAIAVQE